MKRYLLASLLCVALFVVAGFALAATGTISSTNKYAWSNNIGWINFAPTDNSSNYVGLTITDSAVTGYAWSQSYGWINFSCSNQNTCGTANWGVSNNTSGNLSGYAWGQQTGWIDFSNVDINTSTGHFTGTATGTIAGTIAFTCAGTPSCNVVTTWRPTVSSGGGGGGNGGGAGAGGSPGAGGNNNSGGQTNNPTGPTTPQNPPTNPTTPTNPTNPPAGPTQSSTPPASPSTPSTPSTPSSPSVNPSGPTFNPFSGIGSSVGASAGAIVQQLQSLVQNSIENAREVVETPQAQVVAKTVSSAGIVVTTIATAAATVAASSFSFVDVSFLLLRLSNALLAFLGIRRKNLPWGIVYDSVTKQPLDPAYVTLKDLKGNEIASAITDLDGRYGFLVDPGVYTLEAKKTHYAFPSQKLMGKTNDEVYGNLYLGEQIEVKGLGQPISKNIALDPLNFDWNEFMKKDRGFMKFYSKWDLFLRRVSDISFVVGFLVSGAVFLLAPKPYNVVAVVVYCALLFMRVLGLKPKSFGYAVEKGTKNPLSFAIIRIISPHSEREVACKVADKFGRYYCLVPKGQYYAKVEKKNEDGSYSLVYTSPIINASGKGIITQKFEI